MKVYFLELLFRALSSLKVDMEETDIKLLFNSFARPLDRKGADVDVIDGSKIIDAILQSESTKVHKDISNDVQVRIISLLWGSINYGSIVSFRAI